MARKLLELQLSQAQARVQELEAAAAAAALQAQTLERRAVAAEGQVSARRVAAVKSTSRGVAPTAVARGG